MLVHRGYMNYEMFWHGLKLVQEQGAISQTIHELITQLLWQNILFLVKTK